MKTLKVILGVALIATSIFITSCSTKLKGDEAKVAEEQAVGSATGNEIAIDTKMSKVGFTGNGVGKNHPGSFSLNSGTVNIADGKLTGGNFIINAKSLVLDQKEEMFQTKLLGHLLGPDFLDAEKYPTAKFEITSVEPFAPSDKDTSVTPGANYKISGNLTLKSITKNVTFPAKVEISSGVFTALASFNVDRKQWGIVYGNDKSLKDNFISEVVNISLDIRSKQGI
ncbi:MAG: YceI family protein [Bacteroidia bacterium]